MTVRVLVLNASSSRLEFCVYGRQEREAWALDTRGRVAGIGGSPRLIARDGDGAVVAERPLSSGVRDIFAALHVLIGWLQEHYGGSPVLGVGHRVAHGGAKHARPCIITPQVLAELRALTPLAPLQQPYSVAAIEAVAKGFKGVPQVACFDTGFHRGQPAVAQLVPLPERIRAAGVQRYGFHGLSYEHIALALPDVAPEVADGRVVVARLGSGASLCAMRGRQSVDCTLGFTPLDGLCMGTRPGAMDPGVVLYLLQALGMSHKEVEKLLYRGSGLLGLSETSGDMRDLLASSDPRDGLAVDYFVYQAAKHIGALAAVLGGLDALVFTAGMGERSAEIRRRICAALAWLGIELDAAANERHETRITTADSGASAWVIPTDEELMIALHTGGLLGLRAAGEVAISAAGR